MKTVANQVSETRKRVSNILWNRERCQVKTIVRYQVEMKAVSNQVLNQVANIVFHQVENQLKRGLR